LCCRDHVPRRNEFSSCSALQWWLSQAPTQAFREKRGLSNPLFNV
jgi:hypothetical protein